jgi:hypothetical protein
LLIHVCCIINAASGDPYRVAQASKPVENLTDEQLAARKANGKKQAKRLIAVIGALILFAFIAVMFVPKPEPTHFGNSPTVIIGEDAAWGERLRRMVIAAGKPCATAGDPFHQGTDSATGANYWNIHCSDGESYIISLGKFEPRVNSCQAAPRISGTRCFTTIGGK